MDFSLRISEERIREAISKGELDNLKGKGKPLELDDLSGVPAELRMSYKMLKNAGALPEEVQLNKEIASLKDLIAACVDDEEKGNLNKQLNEKMLQFNMTMEKRKLGKSKAFHQYRNKINNKLFRF